MVEQALSLASDRSRLEYQRLQQRQQVANSELLDHEGLAKSLEDAFHSWWLRWLREHKWPDKSQAVTWQQHAIKKPLSVLTPVSNSVNKRITLWLGELTENDRQRLEAMGRRIVPIQGLQTWGATVSLFAKNQHNELVAWLEKGASAESQHWWKSTYPQLIWELEGPLASR